VPLNVVVTPQDASTVSATWDPPHFVNQNGPILRYSINVTRTTGSEEVRVQTTSGTRLLTQSLHPFYTYHYDVAAENSIGRGPSTTVVFQMPEACESLILLNCKCYPTMVKIPSETTFYVLICKHSFSSCWSSAECCSSSPELKEVSTLLGSPSRRAAKRSHQVIPCHHPTKCDRSWREELYHDKY
jgi:hypothetical protein